MARFLAVLLFVATALVGSPETHGAQDAPSAPPDVVVIVWNDAAHERLGFLGAQPGDTPRLDALLAESARFPGGLHVGPRGRPAAATILTGRHPHEHGVYYQTGPKRLASEGSLGVRLA